jgi:hypothetical protein
MVYLDHRKIRLMRTTINALVTKTRARVHVFSTNTLALASLYLNTYTVYSRAYASINRVQLGRPERDAWLPRFRTAHRSWYLAYTRQALR